MANVFGSALLKDALLRPAHGTDTIGVRALLVHPKDDGVRTLYEHSTCNANPIDQYLMDHPLVLLC